MTLIRYDRSATGAPEGLAPVATYHYRPDLLSAEKRDSFDRELEIPEAPYVPGHEVRLMVDTETLGVAWYARSEPAEEGGESGDWFHVLDIDMGG